MEGLNTDRIFDLLQDVKKIGFLGFGKSNRALYAYLSERLAFDAVVRDERETVADVPKDALLLLGKRCFDYAGEDLIFAAPSVRRERPEIRELVARGAVISSDAELFFATEPEHVLAVSGSDGKSTTSALAGAMLGHGGVKSRVVGNFGVPMTPLSSERDVFFVAELSSFMLRYMKPAVRRAVITNVTPNHLNWHESFEEYADTKKGLLENARERVVNCDCPLSRLWGREYGAYAAFSTAVPYSELKREIKAEAYFTFECGSVMKNGQFLTHRSDISLVGMHNVKNALAALSLTDGFCEAKTALDALGSFRGLPHRCELVGEANGIKFYNSSIDSTPERTKATLAAFDVPVTVILGGRDKGLSYEPLRSALKSHAAAVILCGENEGRLHEFISECNVGCPVLHADGMADAVRAAALLGHDTVLSPSATSFDRYSGFEERGRAFTAAVKEL